MHMMNPQRRAHLAPAGKPAPGADDDLGGMGDPDDAGDDKGIGSAQSGYAGPENGPFSCSNCVHFDGQGTCNNPQVQSDPEVNGKVDAEGCCNLFAPGAGGGEEQPDLGGEEAGEAGGEAAVS